MKAEPEPGTPPKRVIFRKRWSGILSGPLQAFAAELCEKLAGGKDFACMLTSAEELHDLNRRFRNNDSSTDVLAFPALGEAGYLGDIAISVPHARLYAREHGHSVDDEIRVLMLHGLLHLLGMDHETDGGAMKRAETRWRRKLALPAGLIERTR